MACYIDTAGTTDLEAFQQCSRVLVKQKWSSFNENKYQVFTSEDRLLFSLREESDGIQFLLGNDRGFQMTAFNTSNEKVFSLRRPYTFGQDKMEVSTGGMVVAVVRKEVTFAKPVYTINNAFDSQVYRVKGGYMTNDFTIQTPSKQTVGSIAKDFAGVAKELFTSRDNYCICFPSNMTVQYKAAVIGTCILIDYKHHE